MVIRSLIHPPRGLHLAVYLPPRSSQASPEKEEGTPSAGSVLGTRPLISASQEGIFPSTPHLVGHEADLPVSLTSKEFPASSPSAPVTGRVSSLAPWLATVWSPTRPLYAWRWNSGHGKLLKDGDQGEPMRAGSEVTSFS